MPGSEPQIQAQTLQNLVNDLANQIMNSAEISIPEMKRDFVKKLIEMHINRIIEETIKKAINAEESIYKCIKDLLAQLASCAIIELDYNEVEKIIRMGWEPQDMNITDIEVYCNKLRVTFDTPTKLRAIIGIYPPLLQSFTKQEYIKYKEVLKRISTVLDIEYYRTKSQKLEQRVKELEQQLKELEEKCEEV